MSERIAILTDAHADADALRSVFDAIDAAGITRIWNLGDFASGGPDPAMCADLCRDGCEINLLGNHEAFVLTRVWEKTNARWARAARYAEPQLGPARLEWLRQLRPHALWLDPSVELVHANLLDPLLGFLRSEADALMSLQRASAPLLLFGHTHRATGYSQTSAGLPDRIRFTLEEPVLLDAAPAALNPGAVCDKVGARWLELDVAADVTTVTWRRTKTRGHGGPWDPASVTA